MPTNSRYRSFNLATKKLITSRDASFDETLLHKDIIPGLGRVIIPVHDSSDDQDPDDSDLDDGSIPAAPAAPATTKERSSTRNIQRHQSSYPPTGYTAWL